MEHPKDRLNRGGLAILLANSTSSWADP